VNTTSDPNTLDFAPIQSWFEWPFEYIWDFGDGNTSIQANPRHTYSQPWEYNVELKLNHADGTKIVNLVVIIPQWNNNFDAEVWIWYSVPDENTYHFESNIISWEWPFEYIWDFGDGDTSTQANPTHTFWYNGNYNISLTITDGFGNEKTVLTNIYISSAQEDLFNIDLFAQPYEWNSPLLVDFDSQILWDNSLEYKYLWNFGDGNTSQSQTTSHTFYQPWSYLVELKVTHPSGKVIQKTITITVLDKDQVISEDDVWNQIDTDWDSIIDINDRCIDLPWDARNQWCPIFDIPCQIDSDCPSSSKCGASSSGNNTCIAVEKEVSCNLFSQGIIQWNVVCDTCPCQNTINFKAQLRACDVIFPAIVSPDGSEIYSKWSYFQIK